MSIEYQIPIILDSGLDSAQQKSANGSQFTVSLEEPIVIPRNAEYAWITVYGATVWNNVYNIREGENDTFYIQQTIDNITINDTITIFPGLYDVDHLNAAIQQQLTNNTSFSNNLFAVVPDTASSRVVIQFNESDTQIDFTQPNTPRNVLGFDSRLVPASGPTGGQQFEFADSTARFPSLEYFTIATDLISRGIRINDRYNQTLVRIPILEPPGSQINYQPQQPPRIPANELIGVKKRTITVWLTDNLLQRVNTNGEPFSVAMNIHYLIENEDKIIDY